VGRAVGFAATFVIPLALVRVFEPTDFGTYKQLFLIYGTLYGIAQLGMAESLYYFVPANSTRAGAHAANAVAVLGAIGIGAAVALSALRAPIAGWLANPALATYLPLIAIALALTLASAALEVVLVSRQRHVAAAVTYAGTDLLRALVMAGAALLFAELYWVLMATIAFAAVRVAVLAWALRREFGAQLELDLPLLRVQLAYALPFAVAVGIDVAQANLHQYVVAARYDAATFAVYAVGCLQIPFVDLIATSVASLMMVRMASDGTEPRMALTLWHNTVCRLAALVFPLTAILIVVARELIVLLFTDAYVQSVPIFVLWTLMSVPAVLCVDAVLRARAATRLLVWMNLVRLVVLATLLGGFLSVFGLQGAVVAALVATVVAKAIGVVKIARLFHVPLIQALPWRRLAALFVCAVLPAVPVWFLVQASQPARAVTVLWAGALYGLLYLALYYRAARLRGAVAFTPSPQPRRVAPWLTQQP
jgi:O-antigen/teichoic acid export membrane protein